MYTVLNQSHTVIIESIKLPRRVLLYNSFERFQTQNKQNDVVPFKGPTPNPQVVDRKNEEVSEFIFFQDTKEPPLKS